MITVNTTCSIMPTLHSLAGHLGPAACVRVYYRGRVFSVFNLFVKIHIFTRLFLIMLNKN